MPKTVLLTDDDKVWLKQNHSKQSYNSMARRIGVCSDTLKRILVREGLQEFDGAKYQCSRDTNVKMWTRPCNSCGSTELRPKNYYFCTPCRRRMGYED